MQSPAGDPFPSSLPALPDPGTTLALLADCCVHVLSEPTIWPALDLTGAVLPPLPATDSTRRVHYAPALSLRSPPGIPIHTRELSQAETGGRTLLPAVP